VLQVTLATLATVLGPAAPALADAARPGDTTSTVESLEPTVEGVRVDIVGGDAFVRLRVERGHEVLVPGYEGEPYLRVLTDGTVEENRRSPATLLNRSRFGEPAEGSGDVIEVDADAEPEWAVIGRDGEVVWHDHRTHYMGRDRPPTISEDGLVQQWELPLVVDGVDVVVTGSIHLRDAPSAAWWVVPLVLAGVALVVASAAVAVRAAPWRGVLVAGSGAALVTLAWVERDVLRHAVVPGADPAWPLRLALAAALAVGPAALALGAASVIWLPPTTSPPRSTDMAVMPEANPSRSGR
jgi:hypothetical protein